MVEPIVTDHRPGWRGGTFAPPPYLSGAFAGLTPQEPEEPTRKPKREPRSERPTQPNTKAEAKKPKALDRLNSLDGARVPSPGDAHAGANENHTLPLQARTPTDAELRLARLRERVLAKQRV